MKKSKIVVPALGILCLSTAAAVTGTVAWFTASRVKNIAMTGITAINPEVGLALNVTNVQHTTVTGNDTDGFSVAHSKLRDASLDLATNATGAAYGSILNDAGVVDGYKAAGNNSDGYAAGTANNQAIYYATAFNAAFTLTRADGYPYNLYFDAANSSCATGSATSEGNDSIMKALRIGVKSGTDFYVWAPNTQETSLKYVNGALAEYSGSETGDALTTAINNHLASKQGTYAGHNAIIGAGTALPTAEIVDNTTAAATQGYLGALSTTALDVKVYTWFEGLDQDCVNSAIDLGSAFTASLAFKMIRSA